MKINAEGCPLKLEKQFVEWLEELLKDHDCDCIISLRNPKYSADKGGFRPVELYISNAQLVYLTDFTFVSDGSYAELVKGVNWEFGSDAYFSQLGIEFPIAETQELFTLYQENLVSYYRMNVFTVEIEEISVFDDEDI